MKNNFTIKNAIIIIASSLFLFAVACDRQDTAEKSTLKAAVADWTGGEITCQVAVSMLEQELNYEVERIEDQDLFLQLMELQFALQTPSLPSD